MKTFLNIRYADKNIAKKHGAKWDPSEKAWYFLGDWASVPEALKTLNGNAPSHNYIDACGGMDCGRRGCDDCR